MVELSGFDNKTTDKRITILIADDHPLVRHALKNLIGKQPDMIVVGEASNGKDAITMAERYLPNIIIMDIGMPVINGLDATRQIKANFAHISVLVLTVHTDKEYVFGILEAGAAGYLTKEVFGEDIIYAIRSICAGEAIIQQSILREILGSFNQTIPKNISTDAFADLTPREISILKLIAKGLSNKVIAAELNLSEYTIKSYIADLFQKMSVGSRTEAVVAGLKAGIIQMNDLG